MTTTIPDYRLEPPDPPKYKPCPYCNSENYEEIVIDIFGNVAGCTDCVKFISAEEYLEDEY